ncbi:MAG: M20/M25/M40 family metallo-hydrolase [Trueperaceae bacterium]
MSSRVAAAAARGTVDAEALQALLLEIATTPAPTGAEAARGEVVARHWRAAGLEPRFDEVGNVVASMPGTGAGRRTAVMLACHLDSVFALDVDVSVDRTDPARWVGAGLGDNAASLAALTQWALQPGSAARPDLTLVATVGEEGLGDLRGARHAVASMGAQHDVFVALDGYLGSVIDVGVGSRRYEATFSAPGGHSWGDYPSPSATHAAGDAMARLADLRVPKVPRSSLNIGQIWGGTSINAIAERAGFNLDMRSVDQAALSGLERVAIGAIRKAAEARGAQVKLTQVGDRPAGTCNSPRLLQAAKDAFEAVGINPTTNAGSTDANAAMAQGIAALCFGVYRGGNAHRLDEWVDPASLVPGVLALRELLARLASLRP